jgi:uncharacterized protein (DUF697 family)
LTSLPVRLSVLRALVKEVSIDTGAPLAVGGARELAPVLRRELGRGAAPGAVRSDDAPEGAAVLVYVLAHEPLPDDEAVLRRARRARVPIVAVAGTGDVSIPYVLATDVVPVRTGEGFPVERIARVVAARLGEDAAPLAARVPLLRRAVAAQLVADFSRRNGVIGAAVFVGGADLPALSLNQARLLLRLEQAYGLEIDPRERLPELAATLGGGVGLRAAARRLVERAPVARWAVQGAVAYLGTRALGEAAVLRLEAGPGSH